MEYLTMTWRDMKNIQYVVMAAGVLMGLTAGGELGAQTKLPNVTYAAVGQFGTPAVSGSDIFRLAGQPFKIHVIANEATHPHAHGKGWGAYTDLPMKGEVTSGLVPQSPFAISSKKTFLALAIGNPNSDMVEIIAPVHAAGQMITVKAVLTLPDNTLAKWLIYPFNNAATLSPSSGTVSYSNGTDTTVLAIAQGTLNAEKGVPGGGAGIE
jgi:hypothetical protein